MRIKYIAFAALAAVCGGSLDAKTARDLPVAKSGNTAFLTSMSERPWWNKAWSRRAPILLSSAASVENRNLMVDAVVDFGEKVNPAEVRLVTPWETEVPCVAESAGGTAVRLIFRTSLRYRENKPFLVYWGNPKARRPDLQASTSMRTDAETIRIMNGKIDLMLDRLGRTKGLIRRLRVLGSQAQSELLMRASDFAWEGFAFNGFKWTNVTVVADNDFKKAVAFESSNMRVTMTVYDEQPRVDWSYELRGGCETGFVISWAPAGDVGFDRIVYPGVSGQALSVAATLDSVTDCIPYEDHDFTPYISKGWYALYDRRERDVVGLIFDRRALGRLSKWGNGQAGGIQMTHRFCHAPYPKKSASDAWNGSGAIVATLGSWKDVESEYEHLAAKPLVFSGVAEGRREIDRRIPSLDKDWVVSIDVNGWNTSKPLPGSEWATNVANHIRAYGANVERTGAGWEELPVPKDLYERIVKTVRDPKFKPPKYGESGKFDGVKFSERCAAAHAKGLGVNIWGKFLPIGSSGVEPGQWSRGDKDMISLDWELQALYPKCGVDCVYNGGAQGENPNIPTPLRKANGNLHFLNWKNRQDFLDAQDANTERVKRFYAEAKKRNPDKPVVMWNSENGEVGREMFMSEQAGYFDTCMVELLPHGNMPHVKTAVKRLRALFDNEPHTVHHHTYFMEQDYAYRVSEMELPFICGCNGFNQENLTYENFDRDAMEITGDFSRLAEYTCLGAKVSRMEAVKNVAVLRNPRTWRDDLLKDRQGKKFGGRTRGDWRIGGFGNIPHYCYDIVVSRYFTPKSLSRYRAVYVPDDPAFTDELASALLSYVKAGGGAVVEGESANAKAINALGLEDGKVRQLGKGRIVWTKDVLTDGLAQKRNAAYTAVKSLVGKVGGRDPYAVVGDAGIDSVLQASSEGLFLGVYNSSTNSSGKGKVKIDFDVLKSRGHVFAQPLFVLDVKNGVRSPLTGDFEAFAGPQQTGFYLIGNEKFTSLPVAKSGKWAGAALEASRPNAKMPSIAAPTNFTPSVAVEVTRGEKGVPTRIRRSREASIEVRPLTVGDCTARRFEEALENATYVHFAGTAKEVDFLFADCAEPLKNLLKRGGGILLDRTDTGPNARKFFALVGVDDPNASAVKGFGDGKAEFVGNSVPTNSLLYPKKAEWFNQCLDYSRVFAKWDRSKQVATHVARLGRDHAMTVVQDKVLGTGKIVFSGNDRAFNDWFENMRYGDAILSWLIGRDVVEHARLVEALNGGPGQRER